MSKNPLAPINQKPKGQVKKQLLKTPAGFVNEPQEPVTSPIGKQILGGVTKFAAAPPISGRNTKSTTQRPTAEKDVKFPSSTKKADAQIATQIFPQQNTKKQVDRPESPTTHDSARSSQGGPEKHLPSSIKGVAKSPSQENIAPQGFKLPKDTRPKQKPAKVKIPALFTNNGLRYEDKYREDLNETLRLARNGEINPETFLKFELQGVKYDQDAAMVGSNISKVVTGKKSKMINNIKLGITQLFADVETAQSYEEVLISAQKYAINNPGSRESTSLKMFVDRFNQANSAAISSAPFVFYKYALQRELRMIAAQVGPMSENNQSHYSERLRSHVSSEKEAFQYYFEEGMNYAKDRCAEQLDSLIKTGTLNIALSNPGVRPFKSKNGVEITDTLSSDQIIAAESIDRAINKSIRNKGGKAEVRIATGGGKSHLTRIIEREYKGKGKIDHVLTVDLNNTNKDLSELGRPGENISQLFDTRDAKDIPAERASEKDLDKVLIQLDEAYFYGMVGAVKGRTRSDAEIEKKRNNVIRNLRNRGATVVVFGASESLSKIAIEIIRIDDKLVESDARAAQMEAENLANRKVNKEFGGNVEGFKNTYSAALNSRVKENKTKDILLLANQHRESGTLTPQIAASLFERFETEILGKSTHDATGTKRPRPTYQTTLVDKEREDIKRVINLGSYNPAGDKAYADKLLKDAIGSSLFRSATEWNKSGNKLTRYVEAIISRSQFLGDKVQDPDGKIQNLVRANRNGVGSSVEIFSAIVEIINDQKLINALTKGHITSLVEEKEKGRDFRIRRAEKLGQFQDLSNRRDKRTVERFDRAAFVSKEKVSAAVKLFDLIESELPVLSSKMVTDIDVKGDSSSYQKFDKMQYVMPDFEINSDTCDAGELYKIQEKTKANIIIIPHNENGTGLKCKIYRKDEGLSEVMSLEALGQFIKDKGNGKTILSFFDKSNFIGGDYGDAGLNVTHQTIHAQNSRKLDWNKLMQSNRNRTPPRADGQDDVSYKFVAHEGIHSEAELDNVKKGLKEVLTRNTELDDESHVVGYLESKINEAERVLGVSSSEDAVQNPAKLERYQRYLEDEVWKDFSASLKGKTQEEIDAEANEAHFDVPDDRSVDGSVSTTQVEASVDSLRRDSLPKDLGGNIPNLGVNTATNSRTNSLKIIASKLAGYGGIGYKDGAVEIAEDGDNKGQYFVTHFSVKRQETKYVIKPDMGSLETDFLTRILLLVEQNLDLMKQKSASLEKALEKIAGKKISWGTADEESLQSIDGTLFYKRSDGALSVTKDLDAQYYAMQNGILTIAMAGESGYRNMSLAEMDGKISEYGDLFQTRGKEIAASAELKTAFTELKKRGVNGVYNDFDVILEEVASKDGKHFAMTTDGERHILDFSDKEVVQVKGNNQTLDFIKLTSDFIKQVIVLADEKTAQKAAEEEALKQQKRDQRQAEIKELKDMAAALDSNEHGKISVKTDSDTVAVNANKDGSFVIELNLEGKKEVYLIDNENITNVTDEANPIVLDDFEVVRNILENTQEKLNEHLEVEAQKLSAVIEESLAIGDPYEVENTTLSRKGGNIEIINKGSAENLVTFQDNKTFQDGKLMGLQDVRNTREFFVTQLEKKRVNLYSNQLSDLLGVLDSKGRELNGIDSNQINPIAIVKGEKETTYTTMLGAGKAAEELVLTRNDKSGLFTIKKGGQGIAIDSTVLIAYGNIIRGKIGEVKDGIEKAKLVAAEKLAQEEAARQLKLSQEQMASLKTNLAELLNVRNNLSEIDLEAANGLATENKDKSYTMSITRDGQTKAENLTFHADESGQITQILDQSRSPINESLGSSALMSYTDAVIGVTKGKADLDLENAKREKETQLEELNRTADRLAKISPELLGDYSVQPVDKSFEITVKDNVPLSYTLDSDKLVNKGETTPLQLAQLKDINAALKTVLASALVKQSEKEAVARGTEALKVNLITLSGTLNSLAALDPTTLEGFATINDDTRKNSKEYTTLIKIAGQRDEEGLSFTVDEKGQVSRIPGIELFGSKALGEYSNAVVAINNEVKSAIQKVEADLQQKAAQKALQEEVKRESETLKAIFDEIATTNGTFPISYTDKKAETATFTKQAGEETFKRTANGSVYSFQDGIVKRGAKNEDVNSNDIKGLQRSLNRILQQEKIRISNLIQDELVAILTKDMLAEVSTKDKRFSLTTKKQDSSLHLNLGQGDKEIAFDAAGIVTIAGKDLDLESLKKTQESLEEFKLAIENEREIEAQAKKAEEAAKEAALVAKAEKEAQEQESRLQFSALKDRLKILASDSDALELVDKDAVKDNGLIKIDRSKAKSSTKETEYSARITRDGQEEDLIFYVKDGQVDRVGKVSEALPSATLEEYIRATNLKIEAVEARSEQAEAEKNAALVVLNNLSTNLTKSDPKFLKEDGYEIKQNTDKSFEISYKAGPNAPQVIYSLNSKKLFNQGNPEVAGDLGLLKAIRSNLEALQRQVSAKTEDALKQESRNLKAIFDEILSEKPRLELKYKLGSKSSEKTAIFAKENGKETFKVTAEGGDYSFVGDVVLRKDKPVTDHSELANVTRRLEAVLQEEKTNVLQNIQKEFTALLTAPDGSLTTEVSTDKDPKFTLTKAEDNSYTLVTENGAKTQKFSFDTGIATVDGDANPNLNILRAALKSTGLFKAQKAVEIEEAAQKAQEAAQKAEQEKTELLTAKSQELKKAFGDLIPEVGGNGNYELDEAVIYSRKAVDGGFEISCNDEAMHKAAASHLNNAVAVIRDNGEKPLTVLKFSDGIAELTKDGESVSTPISDPQILDNLLAIARQELARKAENEEKSQTQLEALKVQLGALIATGNSLRELNPEVADGFISQAVAGEGVQTKKYTAEVIVNNTVVPLTFTADSFGKVIEVKDDKGTLVANYKNEAEFSKYAVAVENIVTATQSRLEENQAFHQTQSEKLLSSFKKLHQVEQALQSEFSIKLSLDIKQTADGVVQSYGTTIAENPLTFETDGQKISRVLSGNTHLSKTTKELAAYEAAIESEYSSRQSSLDSFRELKANEEKAAELAAALKKEAINLGSDDLRDSLTQLIQAEKELNALRGDDEAKSTTDVEMLEGFGLVKCTTTSKLTFSFVEGQAVGIENAAGEKIEPTEENLESYNDDVEGEIEEVKEDLEKVRDQIREMCGKLHAVSKDLEQKGVDVLSAAGLKITAVNDEYQVKFSVKDKGERKYLIGIDSAENVLDTNSVVSIKQLSEMQEALASLGLVVEQKIEEKAQRELAAKEVQDVADQQAALKLKLEELVAAQARIEKVEGEEKDPKTKVTDDGKTVTYTTVINAGKKNQENLSFVFEGDETVKITSNGVLTKNDSGELAKRNSDISSKVLEVEEEALVLEEAKKAILLELNNIAEKLDGKGWIFSKETNESYLRIEKSGDKFIITSDDKEEIPDVVTTELSATDLTKLGSALGLEDLSKARNVLNAAQIELAASQKESATLKNNFAQLSKAQASLTSNGGELTGALLSGDASEETPYSIEIEVDGRKEKIELSSSLNKAVGEVISVTKALSGDRKIPANSAQLAQYNSIIAARVEEVTQSSEAARQLTLKSQQEAAALLERQERDKAEKLKVDSTDLKNKFGKLRATEDSLNLVNGDEAAKSVEIIGTATDTAITYKTKVTKDSEELTFVFEDGQAVKITKADGQAVDAALITSGMLAEHAAVLGIKIPEREVELRLAEEARTNKITELNVLATALKVYDSVLLQGENLTITSEDGKEKIEFTDTSKVKKTYSLDATNITDDAKDAPPLGISHLTVMQTVLEAAQQSIGLKVAEAARIYKLNAEGQAEAYLTALKTNLATLVASGNSLRETDQTIAGRFVSEGVKDEAANTTKYSSVELNAAGGLELDFIVDKDGVVTEVMLSGAASALAADHTNADSLRGYSEAAKTRSEEAGQALQQEIERIAQELLLEEQLRVQAEQAKAEQLKTDSVTLKVKLAQLYETENSLNVINGDKEATSVEEIKDEAVPTKVSYKTSVTKDSEELTFTFEDGQAVKITDSNGKDVDAALITSKMLAEHAAVLDAKIPEREQDLRAAEEARTTKITELNVLAKALKLYDPVLLQGENLTITSEDGKEKIEFTDTSKVKKTYSLDATNITDDAKDAPPLGISHLTVMKTVLEAAQQSIDLKVAEAARAEIEVARLREEAEKTEAGKMTTQSDLLKTALEKMSIAQKAFEDKGGFVADELKKDDKTPNSVTYELDVKGSRGNEKILLTSSTISEPEVNTVTSNNTKPILLENLVEYNQIVNIRVAQLEEGLAQLIISQEALKEQSQEQIDLMKTHLKSLVTSSNSLAEIDVGAAKEFIKEVSEVGGAKTYKADINLPGPKAVEVSFVIDENGEITEISAGEPKVLLAADHSNLKEMTKHAEAAEERSSEVALLLQSKLEEKAAAETAVKLAESESHFVNLKTNLKDLILASEALVKANPNAVESFIKKGEETVDGVSYKAVISTGDPKQNVPLKFLYKDGEVTKVSVDSVEVKAEANNGEMLKGYGESVKELSGKVTEATGIASKAAAKIGKFAKDHLVSDAYEKSKIELQSSFINVSLIGIFNSEQALNKGVKTVEPSVEVSEVGVVKTYKTTISKDGKNLSISSNGKEIVAVTNVDGSKLDEPISSEMLKGCNQILKDKLADLGTKKPTKPKKPSPVIPPLPLQEMAEKEFESKYSDVKTFAYEKLEEIQKDAAFENKLDRAVLKIDAGEKLTTLDKNSLIKFYNKRKAEGEAEIVDKTALDDAEGEVFGKVKALVIEKENLEEVKARVESKKLHSAQVHDHIDETVSEAKTHIGDGPPPSPRDIKGAVAVKLRDKLIGLNTPRSPRGIESMGL